MSAPPPLLISLAAVVAYEPLPATTWDAACALCPAGWTLVCVARGGAVVEVPDPATFGTMRGTGRLYVVPGWVAGKEGPP